VIRLERRLAQHLFTVDTARRLRVLVLEAGRLALHKELMRRLMEPQNHLKEEI
jgi:hypothetical protein